jgi:hypothetical protein
MCEGAFDPAAGSSGRRVIRPPGHPAAGSSGRRVVRIEVQKKFWATCSTVRQYTARARAP